MVPHAPPTPADAPADAPAPTVPRAECLNCGAALVGAFCHACGQRGSVPERVTLRAMWSDFRRHRLNLDRGLLRTLVDVVLRPGAVARAFVDGQRQTYTHPVTLLFLAYAAYALVYGWLDAPLAAMQIEASRAMGSFDGADAQVQAAVERAMTASTRFLYSYGAYFTVLLIVPFAAALRLFLGDRGRTFAECVVLGLTIESAVVLPSALVFTPLAVATGEPGWLLASFGLYLVFAAWAGAQFFDRRADTLALSALSMVLGLMAYMAVLMVLAVGVGIAYGIQMAREGAL